MDQFKSRTPFQGGPLSETLFQDGLLSSELHFEADHCLKLYFEADRFRKPVFLTPVSKSADGFLKEISKVEFQNSFLIFLLTRRLLTLHFFIGLECYGTSKFGNFPDAFWVDMGFQRFAFSGCLLNVITRNFKGPRLSGRIIDKISKVCSF
ncbi:hypothetical protein RCL_jg12081.t1 [Rhizophagus clarus]|uniref:Uncharacterized protein n=1 Tax=Rhizophagus clarus TaxID=94130 RepID=A0A8H3KZR4_9GLOM|nr:hypothetical protein RCL_jg12081.t1 [Rhizophagus clarus]